MNTLQQTLNTGIDLRKNLLEDQHFQNMFYACVDQIESAFKADRKLLLCGNGGSAGDAQHIAAELSGRFILDRAPLFAEALHVNSSYLTAVANDYGYDEVYARMTEAMGRKGDVLIGLSTSGNSQNVLKALQKAKSIGMITVAFLGEKKGENFEDSIRLSLSVTHVHMYTCMCTQHVNIHTYTYTCTHASAHTYQTKQTHRRT